MSTTSTTLEAGPIVVVMSPLKASMLAEALIHGAYGYVRLSICMLFVL